MGSGAELPLQSWKGSIVILEGVASVLIGNEWGDKASRGHAFISMTASTLIESVGFHCVRLCGGGVVLGLQHDKWVKKMGVHGQY